jgi:hypothetical protein
MMLILGNWVVLLRLVLKIGKVTLISSSVIRGVGDSLLSEYGCIKTLV